MALSSDFALIARAVRLVTSSTPEGRHTTAAHPRERRLEDSCNIPPSRVLLSDGREPILDLADQEVD